MADKIILKKLKEFNSEKIYGISAEPREINIFEWHCNIICGRSNTINDEKIPAYLVFHVIMEFKKSYPKTAPEIRILTKFSNTNIKDIKKICVFNETKGTPYTVWTPSYTISGILLQVQAFLLENDIIPTDDCGCGNCNNFKHPKLNFQHQTNIKISPYQACFYTGNSSKESVLGYGVHVADKVSIKPYLISLDAIEMFTSTKNGKFNLISMWGDSINSFVPVIPRDGMSNELFMMIIVEDYIDPKFIIRIMLNCVLDFIMEKKPIDSYSNSPIVIFDNIRIMYNKWIEYIKFNKHLSNIAYTINHPDDKISDIGHLMIESIFCGDKWDSIKNILIRHAFAKNTRYIKCKMNIDRDINLKECFEVVKISMRLISFISNIQSKKSINDVLKINSFSDVDFIVDPIKMIISGKEDFISIYEQ